MVENTTETDNHLQEIEAAGIVIVIKQREWKKSDGDKTKQNELIYEKPNRPFHSFYAGC